MGEERNYDPGIANWVLDKINASGRHPQTGESVTGDGERTVQPPQEASGEGTGNLESSATVDTSGHDGSIHDIQTNNEDVKRAAAGLDATSLAEGPANTSPDLAQGSSGGS
jgi:hypothetical protein